MERTSATRVRPWWWAVSAVLLASAVVAAVVRRDELVSAVRLLADVRPWRLLSAAVCEAVSLACLVALQRWLLRIGGVRIRRRVVAAVVMAANAIAGVLPGGAAFAAAWVYRRYRLRGAGQALAGSALMVAGALSGLSLFVLLLAGTLLGGDSGPSAVLRPVMIGLTALAAVVVAVVYGLSRSHLVRVRAWRTWRRIGLRSPRLLALEDDLSGLGRRVRAARPGVRGRLWPACLALFNWVLDMACLAACMWSLGIGVPWRGLVISYALTQFAGSLRLTPGGLVVVETSLTALLVLDGLSAQQAIAVTLLYRVISYWALQPVGWGSWLALTLSERGRAPTD
ncbi:YbhN family protein [Streptomyces sp. NPDC091292]|uniref:lysylphosphatidylglycerol synthase transmembrane domain-containing protein n=1 Tax=Streptomyces sp. NPDC091292 TaxID=3365991 RepID=UPI00380C26DB